MSEKAVHKKWKEFRQEHVALVRNLSIQAEKDSLAPPSVATN